MGRRLLRVAEIALVVLALALGALLVRALRLPSRQVAAPPAPERRLDDEAAARHLGEAIRIPTISYSSDPAQLPREAFASLRAWLAATYPLLHRRLDVELVSEQSLLYTWHGRSPELEPLLLLAHQDVVPAENAERWSHPPFAGEVADGFVWGRGAIDDKGPLVALCEAVELLLGEGFAPRRTVMLAFGHDEEVGGAAGAAAVAATLAERGVRAALVLDEGFALIEADGLPGLPPLVAPIGIAEKGAATIELVARAPGGHSSTPPRHTAAGVLARAIARLEARPLPVAVGGVTGASAAWLAPELPLWARVPVANLDWLARPLGWLFGDRPAVNAVLRTTTAVTMLSASPKDNVLPVEAIATANFRILPGDRGEEVLEHVRAAVDDPDLELRFKFPPREPTAPAPVDGPAFALLQRTIAELFPEAVVLPALVVGGTDARHYTVVSERLYRFGPFRFDADDIRRPHGVDERLGVRNLADAVRFYARLIESASALEAP